MNEPLSWRDLSALQIGDAPSAAYVRAILHYDPETGVFTWRERPREHFKTHNAFATWNTRFSGSVAGTQRSNGYLIISISGRRFYAHRIASLYMTGEWPEADIDHINGDRADNRFANLREATRSQNNFNAGPQKNNTSGRKGVCWNKRASKWQASIKKNNIQIYLGVFGSIDAAASAYEQAAKELHGEFARTE